MRVIHLENESSVASQICVDDCRKFGTHKPSLVTKACELDCPKNCGKAVCGSDKQTCADLSKATQCPEWSYLLESGECSDFGCPSGFYRDAQSRSCEPCDSECATCTGSRDDQCTSCLASKYLKLQPDSSTEGSCITKTQSQINFRIFVTNDISEIGSGKSNQERDGSADNPFIDLRDAIARAQEISAPVNGPVVTIFLTRGEHYILLDEDRYKPIGTTLDQRNEFYSLILKPLPCGEQASLNRFCVPEGENVRINVKIGAFFSLRSTWLLNFKHITFDYTDSLLRWDSPCQKIRARSCQAEIGLDDKVQVYSLNQECVCQQPLQWAGQCNANHPLSLINMQQNTPSEIIRIVKIENSAFTNIFTHYNAIVGFDAVDGLGGQIQISDTLFQNISMCGAVLNSFIESPSSNNFPHPIIRQFSKPPIVTTNNLLSEKPYIKIFRSTFSQIGLAMIYDQPFHLYQTEYRDQRFESVGHVINLGSFPGEVQIQENVFKDNKFYFDFLTVIDATTRLEFQTSLVKSKFGLIKQGVISVLNHSQGLKLIGNRFQNNSGLRGVVLVEVPSTYEKGVFIYDNTFIHNTGWVRANALNLRSAWTPDAPEACSGFYLEKNKFIQNTNLPREVAQVYLACVPFDFVHSDGIDDISGSQFLHSHKLLSELTPSPKEENVLLPDGDWALVDYTTVLLKENYFVQNFRGRGQGNQIIVMYMQRVVLWGLTLLRNGDISIMNQDFNYQSFWLKRSGLHAQTVIGNTALSFSNLEREVHPLLGDQLLFLGRIPSLIIFGVQSIENWFWQGFSRVPHFMSLIDCKTEITNTTISKLINGVNEDLLAYILRDHDFLDQSKVLVTSEGYDALEGDLIKGNSFVMSNTKLTSFNLTGSLVYPYPGSSYSFTNITYVNAQSEALIATAEVNEVEIADSLFERFVFNDTAVKPNLLTVKNSIFDNQNLTHSGLVGFRLAHIFFNQKVIIENSRFSQICGQDVCKLGFLLSDQETNSIQIKNTVIEKYNASTQMQLISMSGGTLKIVDNSQFRFNEGINAGVFSFFQNTDIQIDQAVFIENSGNTAGVFEIREKVRLRVQNTVFERNRASSTGGVISFTGQSQFEFDNCTFKENKAGEYGSVAQGVSDGIVQHEFRRSKILENKGKNTMSIFKSNVLMDEVVYEGNFDVDGTPAPVYFIASRVDIKASQFSNKKFGGEKCIEESQGFGGFIFGMSENEINIADTLFEKVCALKGGAIYVGVFSKLNINNSEFSECNALSRGGAIFATSTSESEINSCRFQDNSARSGAADIFVQDSAKQFRLKNSSLKYSTHNSLFVERSNLLAEGNNFNKIYLTGQESVLSCEKCWGVELLSNNFTNIESHSAVSITRYLNNPEPFIIRFNRFDNIESTNDGGAIFLDQPFQITLGWNTFNEVIVTKPNGKGGAIYLNQLNKVSTIDTNFFFNCEAPQGGAVFWEYQEPLLLNNTFSDNRATKYARDIGSYARSLQFISAQEGQNFRKGKISVDPVSGQSQVDLYDIQTGKQLPVLYVGIFDKYDQIVTGVNNGTVYLLAREVLQEGEQPSQFKALLSNENTNEWDNGVMKLENIKLNGEPGRDYQIIITSPKIDPNLPDTRDYLERVGLNEINLRLKIQFRLCLSGEKFVSDGACVKCPSNSYLIDPPRSPQECLECPENAICYGGNEIGPIPGYWRSGFQSTNFIPCLYEQSCKESKISENYSPQGTCEAGYFGTLCGSCKTGYTRNTQYKCSNCPAVGANVAILITITIALAIGFIVLIKCSLRSQKQKKSIFTVYFKIMMSHLQLLMLISTFDLEWPKEVHAIFNSSRSVTDAPQQLFSFDCFLQTSLGRPMKRYYLYVLIYFLIPIFLGIGTLLFWKIKLRNHQNLITRRIISTLLISFFLVILGTFKQDWNQIPSCISIDSQLYMVEELSERCWQGSHLDFSFTLGLFGVLLWTLGIPLYSCYLLRQNRRHLHQDITKEKFGFLYNGYNKKSYYWEIIIQLRKVLIAFVAIFLSGRGTIVQSLVLLVILAVFIYITLRVMPFEDRHANLLEIISLIALIITTYCGVFYLSSRSPKRSGYVFGKDYFLSESSKWVLFLAILFANGVFLVMWLLKLIKGIRSTLLNKAPKCYYCCCMCFNRRKMIEEVRRDKKGKENEEIIKNINDVCCELNDYGVKLERLNTLAEQELVTKLTKNMKGELEKINEWRQEKMRNDNFRAASFAEASNKAKKKSTNRLPSGELYEELGTERDSNAPTTRRQLMSENRDSKDFLVDKSGKVKSTKTKPAWIDEENLTSEGNVLSTEGQLVKSKFKKNVEEFGKEEKLKLDDKTLQETESEPARDDEKQRETRGGGESPSKRTPEKNFWEALDR